jgi:hypothetical protein
MLEPTVSCFLGDTALEVIFWIVIKRTCVDSPKNVSWMPYATITYRTPNELGPVLLKPEHRHMSRSSAPAELIEQETMRLRQRNQLETPTR